MTTRPHVAYLSPVSPVGSGISYYSEDLLPVLARGLALDLVVDDYQPTLGKQLQAAGVRIQQGQQFARLLRNERYAATIYQLGNSPAHAYMYPWSLAEPGIAILHDTVLHHLRLWMAVNGGRTERRRYTNDLHTIYGAAGDALAREVLRGKTPTTMFDFPLIEPILDRSPIVLVHSQTSAERVRDLRPQANVQVVPMGVPLPVLPPRDAARARLGLSPDAFVVLSLGHVNPYKRLDVALRAFRRLVEAVPQAQFVIAGSVAPGLDERLARQIGYLGLSSRAQRLGFVDPPIVDDLFAAADCCVNLRYPSAGETSASLLRIMGAGLPVMVSNAGSFRELPPSTALVTPVGPIEEALLTEYLLELARNETLRQSIGAAARDFVANEHSLERSAAGYLRAVGDLLGQPLTLPPEPVPEPLPADMAAEVIPVAMAAVSATAASPAGQASGILDPNPTLDPVAAALVDLRLAEHQPTVQSVARDLTALGLQGMIRQPEQRRQRLNWWRKVRSG